MGAMIAREAVDLAAADPTLDDYEVWASGTAGLFEPVGFRRSPLLAPKDALRAARSLGGVAGAMLAEMVAVYGPVRDRPQAKALRERMVAALDDPPAVLGRLGAVEVGRAWLLRDVWRDGGMVVLECTDADGVTAGVGAQVDPVFGMIAGDFAAGMPIDVLHRMAEEDPHSELIEIDVADAAETMRLALRERSGYIDLPDDEDPNTDLAAYVAHRFSLASADAAGGEPLFRFYEPDDELRELVIWHFLGMSGVEGVPDAEDIAGTICDFAGYCDGDVLCWSPARIEYFLESWVPAKVVADDEWYRNLGPVFREWVLFAATVRELPATAVGISLDVVDAALERMNEFRHDPSMRSPASNIVAAMQADGVDMLDKAAVDAWIEAYNRRPRSDRF